MQAAALRALEREIAGTVALPGSAAYAALRAPAEPRFADAQPAAVVRVASAADVAATLAGARGSGLEVRVRAGGHCFAGRSTTDGVVLDVGDLDAIAVDPARGRVRIGAGARLDAVIGTLAEHGLALPTGCGPEVGIAGLTLGGGLGVLGRIHGLTCDRLTAVTAVAADGTVVRAAESHSDDLFWALRGGGAAGLAVVTELEFATVPAPTVTTTFRLEWPVEHAATVLSGWQEWGPDGPRELAASLHVGAPADPREPAYAEISGAYAGPRAAAKRLLDELAARVGAAPTSAVADEFAWAQAKAQLATLPAPHAPGAHSTRRSAFHAVPLDSSRRRPRGGSARRPRLLRR